MSAPSYKLSDFKKAATSFFGATTGRSPLVSKAYNKMDAQFLNKPMTPDNINQFVDIENNTVLRGKSTAWQDNLAKAMTPLRRPAAHFVAQNATVGRLGFFDQNEYSREAFSGVVSGTF